MWPKSMWRCFRGWDTRIKGIKGIEGIETIEGMDEQLPFSPFIPFNPFYPRPMNLLMISSLRASRFGRQAGSLAAT
jgi:hypothetical protein